MNFKKIIANTLAALAVAAITTAGFSAPASVEAAAVSYTHLTLPTKA